MKKFAILTLTLVLTASLFAGCRMRSDNQQDGGSDVSMPSTIVNPTTSTTEPNTTRHTTPSEPENNPTDDTAGDSGFVEQDPTDTTGAGNPRGRRGMGNIQ